MSGKGGSGKTSICVTIAKSLSMQDKRVLLIDGDTGTGGMTYYLGLHLVQNKKVGILDFQDKEMSIDSITQRFENDENIYFVGLGDHRKYNRKNENSYHIAESIKYIIDKSYSDFDFIIVDCRGGIDKESLNVAEIVEDIFFVVEPDTTSFQATQHLSETLSDYNLSHKIKGFVINKVFDNPEAVARHGSGVFGGKFLGAIPFDIEAMRSFLVGNIVHTKSLYFSHIWKAFYNAYPLLIDKVPFKTLNSNEYNKISTLNPNSQIGNLFLGFISILLIILLILSDRLLRIEIVEYRILQYSLYTLVILNISTFFKENIGFMIKKFGNIISRIASS